VLAGLGEPVGGLGLFGHWSRSKNISGGDSEGWRLALDADCEAQSAPVTALDADHPIQRKLR